MASPIVLPTAQERASTDSPFLIIPPQKSFNVVGAVGACVAIAALYVYFLVFGELAFLNVVMAALPKGNVFVFLSALGCGGVIGSLACAFVFRGKSGKYLAAVGFGLCAVAAPLTLHVHTQNGLLAASWVSGAALGWATVSLALCIRPTTHGRRLGLVCGLGTGTAYAICNLPIVLEANPQVQIYIATGAALVGLLATLPMRSNPHKSSGALDYRPATASIWIGVFTLLVWLDSAAYFIIQHSEAMKTLTWDANLMLYGNGFLHFTAALLTGLALDRHHFTTTLVSAAGLLVAACLILAGSPQLHALAHVLYVGAASIYSTALVYYPARSGRRWIAAALFAVGGWGGSALGVTMASQIRELPAWAVGVGGVMLTAALIARKWTRGDEGDGVRF